MYCAPLDVAAYLRTSFDDSQIALVDDLIEAASQTIDDIAHRSFDPSASQETLTLDGGDGYAVATKYPVREVAAVTVGGYALDTWTLSGRIIYSSGIIRGLKNVEVTGAFGYEETPAPIKHACVRIVAEMLKPHLNENFGVEVSWMQDSRIEFEAISENNPDIYRTLLRYKRWF